MEQDENEQILNKLEAIRSKLSAIDSGIGWLCVWLFFIMIAQCDGDPQRIVIEDARPSAIEQIYLGIKNDIQSKETQ